MYGIVCETGNVSRNTSSSCLNREVKGLEESSRVRGRRSRTKRHQETKVSKVSKVSEGGDHCAALCCERELLGAVISVDH